MSTGAIGVSLVHWLQRSQEGQHEPHHHNNHHPFNTTIASYLASTRIRCPSSTCMFVFFILPIGYAVLAYFSWRRMRSSGCCCRSDVEDEIHDFGLELEGEREVQQNPIAEHHVAPGIEII